MEKIVDNFIDKLSYYEQINLLMCFYAANDASLSRVEAYEMATIHFGDERILQRSLESMISLGPTSRK